MKMSINYWKVRVDEEDAGDWGRGDPVVYK